jgi:dihydroneopterin aldolase
LLGALFGVDVSVECEIEKAITTIDEAINYELIFNLVKNQMGIPQDLVETVAQHILSDLKQAFHQAQQIEVTIHKPNPAGSFKSGVASVKVRG